MKQATKSNTRIANTAYPSRNDYLRQSLCIAALDRQIGIRGFIPAVTDAVGNLDYDFYHTKTGRFVKIFRELHAGEMERYEEFRPELAPIYIIDADDLPSCSKELTEAIMRFHVLLFKDECLWEWDNDKWTRIPTAEMQRCLCALYNGDKE
jgi:hypothetical protein